MFPRITEGYGYLPDTDYKFDKYDHRIVHTGAEATEKLRLNPLLVYGPCGSVIKKCTTLTDFPVGRWGAQQKRRIENHINVSILIIKM